MTDAAATNDPSASDTTAPPVDKTPPASELPGTISLHSITGFTSSGLFLAASIVNMVHLAALMHQGHRYRDSIGFNEDTGNEAVRSSEVMKLWNDPTQQILR